MASRFLVRLSTNDQWDLLTPVCVLSQEEAKELCRLATAAIRMARRWSKGMALPVDEIAFRTWCNVASEKRLRSAVLGRHYDDVPYDDTPADAPISDVEFITWLEQGDDPLIVQVDEQGFDACLTETWGDDTDLSISSIRLLVDPDRMQDPESKHDYYLDLSVSFKHYDSPLRPYGRLSLNALRAFTEST